MQLTWECDQSEDGSGKIGVISDVGKVIFKYFPSANFIKSDTFLCNIAVIMHSFSDLGKGVLKFFPTCFRIGFVEFVFHMSPFFLPIATIFTNSHCLMIDHNITASSY